MDPAGRSEALVRARSDPPAGDDDPHGGRAGGRRRGPADAGASCPSRVTAGADSHHDRPRRPVPAAGRLSRAGVPLRRGGRLAFEGHRIGAGDEAVELKVRRDGEPAAGPPLRTLPPLLPREEEKALARRLIGTDLTLLTGEATRESYPLAHSCAGSTSTGPGTWSKPCGGHPPEARSFAGSVR